MKRLIFSVILQTITAVSIFAAKPVADMQPEALKAGNFSYIESDIPCKVILANNPDSAGMITFCISPLYKDLFSFSVNKGKLKCSVKKAGSFTIKQGSSTYTLHKSKSGNSMYRGAGSQKAKDIVYISDITIYVPRKLDGVTINGSGTIKSDSQIRLGDKINLCVNGSGDIKLRSAVTTSLTATVNGSGDIKLKDTSVSKLSVSVNGSGDVDLTGNTTATELECAVSGSGDIDIKALNADKLSAGVYGSGDIEIAGKAISATYTVTGSGDVDCDKVKVNSVTATVTGSGSIDCYASRDFTGSVTRAGNIKCLGSPANINLSGNKRRISVR